MKAFKKFVKEDGEAPQVAPGAGTTAPVTSSADIQKFDPVLGITRGPLKRKFQEFTVDEEAFNKFQKGKTRFSRWSSYLNMEDESHRQIYDYARKNPRGVIILKNSTSGALRQIRRNAANE